MFQKTAGVSVLVMVDWRPPVEWPDHSFPSSLHPPVIKSFAFVVVQENEILAFCD